ncbi:MAG: HIT domain-containing protein [Chloroflexi bacterium]|nr:HIT domain-containing protein [Chloroflexota bacterium]
MEIIWAPWRVQYIEIEKPKGCILCDKPAESNDRANYILYRGKHSFIILNAYPYNPGHLMISPYRHIATLEAMSAAERQEHFDLVCQSTAILREVFRPQGFNIGINLGRVSGAGIDDHVHTHVVPRWGGDTNFMPVVADTKVLPQALGETYQRLKDRF